MRNLVISPNRAAISFDKIFDDMFTGSADCCNFNSDFSPRVNITETDDQVKLNFELPGIEKSGIKVTVKDGLLTVSGERKTEQKTEGENFVRSEIFTGKFSRSFTLPKTVEADKIKADYKNGMLLITLPKTEEARPKEIDVNIN